MHDISSIANIFDVGTMLLEHKATLFPIIICTNINEHLTQLEAEKGVPNPPELNSRWVLGEITAKYQHHVAYVCKVRKYGTLVYRPTSDMHALLSEALWKKEGHVEMKTMMYKWHLSLGVKEPTALPI